MKKSIMYTLFFFVSMVVYTGVAHAQTGRDCYTIKTLFDVPQGYASPINLFGNTFLMKTYCESDGSVTAQVGDGSQTQYIYKYGYQRVDGEWKRITYTGANQKGPWLIGSATATLHPEGESGKYIAYICQKVSNRWKCGCSDQACTKARWQVQTYDTTEIADASPFDSEEIEEIDLQNSEALTNMFGWGYDELAIHYPSRYVAAPGETVKLTGSGFSTDGESTVLWNGKVAQENLSSENGMTLDITVPDFEPGKYRIHVEQNGEQTQYGTVIWIGNGESDPVITEVTPQTIEQGDTITIHGTGFDPENNDVLTSLNEYNEVQSKDGETITLTFDPYEKRRKMYNMDAEHIEYEELVYVTVINTAGVSNEVTFYLAYD